MSTYNLRPRKRPASEAVPVAPRAKAPKLLEPKALKLAEPKAPKLAEPKAPKVSKASKAAEAKATKLVEPKLPEAVVVQNYVLTFGDDTAGEMGLGEIGLSKKLPLPLQEIKESIQMIACGAMHTLCLTSQGEVYTFGCNDELSLGRMATSDDEDTDYSTPKKISLPDKVTKVTAGDSHSAALTRKGKVFIWGNFKDEHGSVGLTPGCDGKASVQPISILDKENFIDIASGSNHMLLLNNQGKVYSFGVGEQGQLGRIDKDDMKKITPKTRDLYLKPQLVDLSQVDPQRTFVCDAVFAGNYSSFARNSDKKKNRLAGWGLNNYHQLGYKGQKDDLVQYFPKRSTFTCSTSMQSVACGQHHTLFLTKTGRVHAAGRPEYGRLGLGNTDAVTCPAKPVTALKDYKVVDISAGTCSSFAVIEEGDLYSWGMSGTNLGLRNDEEDALEPKKVECKSLVNKKVISVSAGSSFTAILAHNTELKRE